MMRSLLITEPGPVTPGQQLGVLEGLSADGLDALERAVTEVRLPAGALVFGVGDPGDSLYLVRSGLIDVVAQGPAGATRVATIGPGETVGEQSLLSGRPRSAAAVAQTGVTLWRLDHADFIQLVASLPQFGANVARIVAERLTAAGRTRLGLPRGQTVLLLSLSPKVTGAVARRLAQASSRLVGEKPLVLACGPATTWSRSALPKETTVHDGEELAGIAVRSVRDHALVLLLCGPDVPASLLAGADRVIAVGDINIKNERDERSRPIVALPEHVDDNGIDGLAREICGRRVGVALGSGGIRGFAHAGVLGVLADEGIPIDFLSGSSVGAIAGALFLRGMAPRDLADLSFALRETAKTGRPSFTLSPQSLLPGRRLSAFLRNRLGAETTFADLPKPFVVAATDLATRAAVQLDAGPLAEAVAASAAMPGVFPALAIGGRRLVDGGTSDPVPVRALRERGADIVIAVNVMTIGRGSLGALVELPRLRIPMPAVVDNLFISLDTIMSQLAAHACRQADVVVEPTQGEHHWYDVMPAQAYMQAGERAMRDALPQVRRLLGIPAHRPKRT
jgi:NTE family protein